MQYTPPAAVAAVGSTSVTVTQCSGQVTECKDITDNLASPWLSVRLYTPHAGECQAEYECLMSCDGRRASLGGASSPAECCMRPGVGGYVVGVKASGDCHDCWDSGPLQPFSSSMSAICSV